MDICQGGCEEGFCARHFSKNDVLRLCRARFICGLKRCSLHAALAAIVLLITTPAWAQVAVDTANTSSGQAELTRTANALTFPHNTSAANMVLVVGISENISQQSTGASGVSYNGVSLTQAGVHNDSSGSRRTEIWYLINPSTGSHNVVVSVPITGGATIGTVAGATTFTGADQTTPIRNYASNDSNGTNGTSAYVNVTSAAGDYVLETLAAASGETVTLTSTAQVQQWSLDSVGGSRDVHGFGSTRAGAASVPMSENLSASSAWSDSAVSIQPVQADLSVTASGSSTLFPASVTYTVGINNGGPSVASTVSLTDTLASGLTLVSAVATGGGTCTGVNCSWTSIAANGSVSVTITATPAVPGGYPLSASVSSTTADLNSSNNSATAVSYSEFAQCSTATAATGTNLTGVINTYYPGTASANAGSRTISVGAGTGKGDNIAIGDLLLIMQMQDAAIDAVNSSLYGDGVSGSGSTNLNNAGVYEYATAASAVSAGTGGTLTVQAAGPGGGLLYTYTSAAASSTQGARTFQVIRVPDYATASLAAGLTASPWNGSSGGVLALNVTGTLTLGGVSVSVNGLGFRGAAGLQLNGGATGATNSDYLYTSPTTYTTGSAPVAGADGSKGEGIAGTPHWLESGGTVVSSGQTYAEGYPNGSMARGAPGNAGGGATDSDPATAAPNGNDQNAGGGGGANGGTGGQGGNSWKTNLTVGGLGGASFPSGIGRVVMGGGGGAGSRNNTNGDTQASSGAAGGGIVMIRAGTISGNVTITANGSAAYNNTANDGGGGGGAGGSIVFLWSSVTGTPAITLNANGGRGGDAWDTDNGGAQNGLNADRHGPGGGGGGGVLLYKGAAAAMTTSVTGGAAGITLNVANLFYGATAGTSGTTASGFLPDSAPGPHSALACTDVSITKTGSPSPVVVNQGLTYTITVTNTSTTTAATAVTVTDTIPTDVTFGSASISGGTGGSCPAPIAGVLNCTFTSIAANTSATITVNTTASTAYTEAVNTAIVNSATPDPNPTNNTATASVAIEGPTAVRVQSFSATQTANGVLLRWKTGGEVHNLGFNVYREAAGENIRLNPSLIAGSALLMREALEQHGARTYAWIDNSATRGLYWLEDVDLNGTRTMHGPIQVEANINAAAIRPPIRATARAATISDLARATSMQNGSAASDPTTQAQARVREAVARPNMSAATREVGFELAARSAVKILVDHEGWYRITQPQLVAAGLYRDAEAKSLHLYAEGVEQPVRITGEDEVFGSQSAIEFYGTGIDTPYSGRRVYWLTTSEQIGKRVTTEWIPGSSGPQAQSFVQTLELKPRTTYFAALLRDDTDNFFGPLVSSSSATLSMKVSNLAQGESVLEIALQGVTQGQQHNVTVALNGSTLGDVTFSDQQEGKGRFTIPAGVLANGANTITLTAQQGTNDLSLVDYVDLSFPQAFVAESDQLKFTAPAGSGVSVAGFAHAPTRLIDTTNPQQPVLVPFKNSGQQGSYALQATVPWTSSGDHSLLAISDDRLGMPAAVVKHQPSHFHAAQRGAQLVILTAPQFASQFEAIAKMHEAQGESTALVNVNEVYDEFNFGERSPYAVRDFLKSATEEWKTKPRYLLLAGDASVDPRNYLGFGFLDFVPTKIVITSELKTASDDWFSDFNNTGFATIATGRLPARTAGDAQIITGKILSYATGQGGSWTNQSLMVAGVDDPTLSFSQAARAVQKLLPQTMNVTDVFASAVGAGTARQNILTAVNSGQLLVNYNGHGSVEIWGNDLLDDSAATSLANGTKLPLVVAMNCLNGFFHDVYTQSLATALMLAPNGGSVAVWASSGLTVPDPQFQMDRTLVQTLFSTPGIPIGDAILHAKSNVSDQDARTTFIFFGDPLMRLRTPDISSSGE